MPNAFWWITIAAGVGYIGLFLLAHRPMALRLGRLGWMLVAVLALRAGLAMLCHPVQAGRDASLAVTALVGAASLAFGARIWLVRATGEELREQITTACRGLFLECEESLPGRFVFSAKGETRQLRTRELGDRMQLVVLPRLAGHRKVALLLDWLSKQYAGPIPRVPIVLKRREP